MVVKTSTEEAQALDWVGHRQLELLKVLSEIDADTEKPWRSNIHGRRLGKTLFCEKNMKGCDVIPEAAKRRLWRLHESSPNGFVLFT